MTQGEPAAAAGACGSRITRQSALASGAIRELSWAGSGVATGPSGPSDERRAQVVGALVVGGQVAAEHRRFAARARRRRARQAGGSAAPGTGTRRHRTTPDCRAGRAPACAPSRPCIIGRPGRSATRQNDRSSPSAASARCTRSCSPTEAPPVVTSISAPPVARAPHRRGDVLDAVRHDAEIDHLGAFAARQRHQRKAVGIDDLARRRACCPAPPVRRRCRAPRPWAGDARGSVG